VQRVRLDGQVEIGRWAEAVIAIALTAAAALSGDRKLALQAFVQDPQTQARLDRDDIVKMMDELFEAHRRDLPQFFAD